MEGSIQTEGGSAEINCLYFRYFSKNESIKCIFVSGSHNPWLVLGNGESQPEDSKCGPANFSLPL